MSQVGGPDRVRISNTGAYIRYLNGDVPAAQRAFRETVTLAKQLNDRWVMLDAHYYLAQLDLLSGDLQAVQERYFAVDNGELVTTRPVMPSMFTLDMKIIRQDCLGYLMERLLPK